jgi:hypothetical protein
MGSFSWFQWLIVGLVIVFLVKLFGGARAKKPAQPVAGQQGQVSANMHHCMMCGSDMWPRKIVRGSFFIEIILWLCFLVPGIIYTIWRLTTKKQACSVCGSEAVVPAYAPAAVNHRKALGVTAT